MVLSRDVPRAVVAAKVRSGDWERIRPGAYIMRADGLDRFALVERHALARVAAVDAKLTVEHVLSHESAALLWGLPLVGDGSTVHVIQQVTPHRGHEDVRRHRHRLAAEDVVELAGRTVTTLERTVADCASTLPARDGLVIADAALRRGLDRDRCRELLHRRRGRRGVQKGLAVVELADEGAESPGESRMRHLVLRAGLPVPQTQLRVDTAEGSAWGDLGWPEWLVLAEYDGAAKYTARSSAPTAVLKERRREVAIERCGWRVARATSRDLHRPRAFLDSVLQLAPDGVRSELRPRPWLL